MVCTFIRRSDRLFPKPRQFLAAGSSAKYAAVAAGEQRFSVRRKAEARRIAFRSQQRARLAVVVRSQSAFFERMARKLLSVGQVPNHHVTRLLAARGDNVCIGSKERMRQTANAHL